jgi:hypothetical protein
MSWRRAALDERLEILKEQLSEQLSREDGGLLDWLEHQITELMTVAACSDHGDYVDMQAGHVRATIGFSVDGAAPAIGAASVALGEPSAG